MSYWGNAKKMISDINFLQSLLDFDKENIPSSVIDKLKVYIEDPEFVPVKIQRVSLAGIHL